MTGLWACCATNPLLGTASHVGAAQMEFLTSCSGVYQWAYQKAVDTVRLSQPGRYIEPGVN
jgi:hypothetical protein